MGQASRLRSNGFEILRRDDLLPSLLSKPASISHPALRVRFYSTGFCTAIVSPPALDRNRRHMIPPLSIVIPTFNRAGTICSAIESVRQQALDDCEILV